MYKVILIRNADTHLSKSTQTFVLKQPQKGTKHFLKKFLLLLKMLKFKMNMIGYFVNISVKIASMK